MDLFERIQTLCEINGISGRETPVAEEIIRQIGDAADKVTADPLGNVLVWKKGKQQPRSRVMFCAHMDEVGMMVTGVTPEGFLRVAAVGGINPKVIAGRRVAVGDKNLPGVIGSKAIHLSSNEERESAPKLDQLYLDIGAKVREEALTLISLGDSVHFAGGYEEFGDGFLVAKAIDDRAGCAILLELLHTELEYDAWFCFAVQEEVGGRGAKAAAYTIQPDIAVVVESTASGDVSGVEGDNRVCVVGDGAVVSFMDRSTIYDKDLYDFAFALAARKGIPCQTKTKIAGGNDAGVIQSAAGGARCMAISIPSRYIHSASDVAKRSDIQAVADLVQAVAGEIGAL